MRERERKCASVPLPDIGVIRSCWKCSGAYRSPQSPRSTTVSGLDDPIMAVSRQLGPKLSDHQDQCRGTCTKSNMSFINIQLGWQQWYEEYLSMIHKMIFFAIIRYDSRSYILPILHRVMHAYMHAYGGVWMHWSASLHHITVLVDRRNFFSNFNCVAEVVHPWEMLSGLVLTIRSQLFIHHNCYWTISSN